MIQTQTTSPRVASLLPAATEIVAGLGLDHLLVGRSHECDHPSSVHALPALTRSRVDVSGASGAIDARVREATQSALGVYDVDMELLAHVDPDVVITQDLCDVCAVPFAAVERAVREATKPTTRIVSLKPQRLADVWRDVRTVADALGESELGARYVASLEQRVDELRRAAARLSRTPRVLTIEWIDPVMIGGTWMPELVELAHATPLVTRPGDRAPTLSIEQLKKLRPKPDVVLFKPCGFTLARSLMEIESLTRLVTQLDWPACVTGEIYLADGNAFFNRPGPRLVESLEILLAAAHGFDFRHLAAKHSQSFQRLALRKGNLLAS